jgi:SP family myo-inositol transporter-like MFS transporter 13
MSNIKYGLIVGLALLGASIGSLISGTLSDKIGRKKAIIISDILLTMGSVFMFFAYSIPLLMIGRFIVGLGIGFSSMVVPVYVAEMSPAEIRGGMVSLY